MSRYVRHSKNLAARPIVTTRLLVGLVVTLAIMAAVGYLLLQIIALAGGPRLEVFSPQNNQIINGRELEITGRATPGSSLYIDGNFTEVVAENGSFRIKTTLAPGTRRLTIEAENSTGQRSQVVRNILVELPSD